MQNKAKTQEKQAGVIELKGGAWRRNPGEIRPITGDGTGEPDRQETGQKEPERTPLKHIEKQR